MGILLKASLAAFAAACGLLSVSVLVCDCFLI